MLVRRVMSTQKTWGQAPQLKRASIVSTALSWGKLGFLTNSISSGVAAPLVEPRIPAFTTAILSSNMLATVLRIGLSGATAAAATGDTNGQPQRGEQAYQSPVVQNFFHRNSSSSKK